jgi:hypothetical protein
MSHLYVNQKIIKLKIYNIKLKNETELKIKAEYIGTPIKGTINEIKCFQNRF